VQLKDGNGVLIFDPTRNVRPNTLDFKPPLPNPLVQKIFTWLLPFINGRVLNGLRVEIDAASLERLNAIRGQRCLLLPNHPSEWDPCVMFEMGRRLKENFFFVAAREVFDYSYGLRGWFFQRLGVYSLVRGSNDRKSLKTSMDILAQNKGRLVIFVEGEISNQNESLLPLETGVVQLALMALNDCYKQGGKNLEQVPSLYVCPVAIRYVYDSDGLEEAIDEAVNRLELAVDVTEKANSRHDRLKALSKAMLVGAAAQFGYDLNPEFSTVANMVGLSDFMLTKLEQIINLPPEATLSHLDRIRRIRNTVDKILGQPQEDGSSAYQKRLFEHQKAVLKHFYQDLDRAVNFVAIYDGYLHPDMDAARYVQLLRRLEKEVFGHFILAHPRTGHVRVMPPIDLKHWFSAFLEDKHATAQNIAQEVERQIYAGLQPAEPKTLVSASTDSQLAG
jgi:1-acyl-sn-glycerol-3-phosphate acyltransferase